MTRHESGWVRPVVLEGAHVRLEPLRVEHAGELFEAATPETFRYFSRGPRAWSIEGMRGFVEFLLGPAGTVAFCVVERASGRRVGVTTFLDIRPDHRGLEIGWTWLSPRLRGTRVNPEMKRMMLGHAFDELGAIRVCLKTDERNGLSRAAILKLGARFEGIVREVVIMPDGFRRSTAMYSVLAGEWAGVRAGLDGRLGESGGVAK